MPISTPTTLIRYLQTREVGPETWKNLVDHYGPAICAWCTRRGLQLADAQDVTQNVLVKMFRRLEAFEYDPAVRFRPYLRRLIRSGLADCVEKAKGFAPPGGAESDASLEGHPARVELEQALRERFDHELLAEAMVRVAQQVAPKTWEAFRQQAFEGRTGPEAAAALGISVASAYMAKSNVQKRLRAELQLLGGDDAAAPDPIE